MHSKVATAWSCSYRFSFIRFINMQWPVNTINKQSHTYKCWCSSCLLAYIITTVGPHFKGGCSQWSEPLLSCDDYSSGRTIHSQWPLVVTTFFLVPKLNLIFSDISSVSSIRWRIPAQCHRRFVLIHSSCQVLNGAWSESCTGR